jgi:PAS domain S-box-containing protein
MQNSVTWEPEAKAKSSALTGGRAYLLAVGCTGLAWLLRFGLDPLWTDRLPFATFCFAAIVVMQFTEVGPSVISVVAGFFLGAWFFAAPRHSLLLSSSLDRINSFIYFGICFVVLLITQRARRALARERAAWAALGRLAAIIESSDDAIIGRTLDGKIVSWNAGATKLYGYTEAEALGQPLAFMVEPEGIQELTPLLERVARGEQISHLETVRRKKDGRLAEVSLGISPVRNSAGQIIGVSTIARDIAERKRAEQERERLVEDLQRVLGEVKTLSGLLPICSYCKKIRDDKGCWNQIEHYLRERSRVNFTHSVCPECASLHYDDFLGQKDKA